MSYIGSQIRQVFRRLVRTPMFTAVTLITLAAGVGANTVVFSVLEGILLKPLPYPEASELVTVSHAAPGINIPELPGAPSNYFIYREHNRSFEDIGLMTGDSVSITGIAEPEQVRAQRVTDGIIDILGVPPMLGRDFTREDDQPGAPATVILTHGYWQRKFGGNRNLLGQSLKIDGELRQVIGIMPPNFHLLDDEDPAVLLPFQFDRAKLFLGNFSYTGLARLKPGVTMEQASSDVARMIPMVQESFPPPPGFNIKMLEQARLGPNIKPLMNAVVGDVGQTLWILMGSIGLVLLIACANVANLVLVRVEGRRHELAVRAALGASWKRIASELMIESLVLGLLGGLLGLGLAWAALKVLVASAPQGLPRVNEIGFDIWVLLFTLGIALLASVLSGSIPVIKYAGVRLATGMRESARGMTQSREQHRTRNTLVVVQVALALVLLICSGLMARTFVALTKVQAGFQKPEEIQTFALSIPESELKDEAVPRTYEQIVRQLEALPGVSSVALSTSIPMDGNESYDPVFAEDKVYPPGEMAPLRRFKWVSPGFMTTLGTPLVSGRDLTWDDINNLRPVAMVSESLAREMWQSPSAALGKRIRMTEADPWREVVGVVGDLHDDGLNEEPSKAVYWPMAMKNFAGQELRVMRSMAFAVRTPRAGTESLMKDVRQAVWSVNPNLPLAEVNTAAHYYRSSLARTSFTLLILAIAGAMALLLGTVGIYGIIAYSVLQRTHEIGIRMALGAQTQTVTRMFVRQGLTLTLIGVIIGLVAAVLSMRFLSSLLYGVKPVDLLTYAAVSIGLTLTALLASYLPSRRAASVDPLEALRGE